MAPRSPAAALLRAIRTNPGISRSPRLLHKACLRHTRIFRISCARTMRHAGVSLRVAVAVRPIGSPDRSNLHPGCCSLDRSCDFQARKRPIFRVIGPSCVSERTGWTDRAILRKRPACCKTNDRRPGGVTVSPGRRHSKGKRVMMYGALVAVRCPCYLLGRCGAYPPAWRNPSVS